MFYNLQIGESTQLNSISMSCASLRGLFLVSLEAERHHSWELELNYTETDWVLRQLVRKPTTSISSGSVVVCTVLSLLLALTGSGAKRSSTKKRAFCWEHQQSSASFLHKKVEHVSYQAPVTTWTQFGLGLTNLFWKST